MIRAGALIIVGSWVPLLVAGLAFGMDNPIGAGLLAWLGSAFGFILLAIGGFVRLCRIACRDPDGSG